MLERAGKVEEKQLQSERNEIVMDLNFAFWLGLLGCSLKVSATAIKKRVPTRAMFC